MVKRVPGVASVDALAGTVAAYTRDSIPDGLKWLAPSNEHLVTMATAKLNARLAELQAALAPKAADAAQRDAVRP